MIKNELRNFIKNTKVVKNSFFLYLITFARMVFPLITLPYLTRILSIESYGVNTFVNSVMSYFQLTIDFGFILSSTAKIVGVKDNNKKIGEVVGNTIVAKIFLSILSFIFIILLVGKIDILEKYTVFTLLSFLNVVLSIFMLDFFFQGIEQMHILAIRFIIMKGISTILTFIIVKDDADLLLIPILNIIASGSAVFISLYEAHVKFRLKIIITNFKDVFLILKNSFTYWLSDISSTAFTALNTILIGAFINSKEVAYWGVSIQIISTIQSLYSPINTGIYPEMIKQPNTKIIRTVIKIFFPVVTIGCIILYVFSPFILNILGGNKYLPSVPILRSLIPLLFISFFSLLYGWPVLGAIEKAKAVTFSTVTAALLQILGLFVLLCINKFSIINIAHLRFFTELYMLLVRFYFRIKYKDYFVNETL